MAYCLFTKLSLADLDSKSTANRSRSTGLFWTKPYQRVNISRNLQYFPPLRRDVNPFRIVYEIVTSVWNIKLRSFHVTKIHVKFLLGFSFLILHHLLRLFFFFNIEPGREEHRSRWQGDAPELRGGEFLCPSAWRFSRATANSHQGAPRQHCTGRHSAGEGLPFLTSVLSSVWTIGTNQISAPFVNEVLEQRGPDKGECAS